MKRSLSLLAIALIALGVVFTFRTSRANDQEKKVTTLTGVEISNALDLIERIENLEKRIAKLERPESFVQQVDSRNSSELKQPDIYVPDGRPSEIEGTIDGDDDDSLQTNGQRWRFRLLGNRQPSTSLIR